MAHRAPLLVVPYSAKWPKQFEAEQVGLAKVFDGVFCAIEHIGSTAVSGLVAKPIIDIMLGVRSLSEVAVRVGAMEHFGYEYMPQHERVFPERRFFARPLIRPRQFHVHAVVFGSSFWDEHLLFRDALRADQALARSYASLKQSLAAEFAEDREGYTNAKSPFITSVVRGTTQVPLRG